MNLCNKEGCPRVATTAVAIAFYPAAISLRLLSKGEPMSRVIYAPIFCDAHFDQVVIEDLVSREYFANLTRSIETMIQCEADPLATKIVRVALDDPEYLRLLKTQAEKRSDLEARRRAIESLDMDFMRERYPASDDEKRLITLHQARYELSEIAAELRNQSRAWLEVRGLKRHGGLGWCEIEPGVFDHSWKFVDDSFDDEYGTRQIHYWRCDNCDAEREYDGDRGEE